MSLSFLPDLTGMLTLMGVLLWIRHRYKEPRVDLWIPGLSFILLEQLAFVLYRGGGNNSRLLHVVALNAYLLAAVSFSWSARREVLREGRRRSLFFLPVLPLSLLVTLYGLRFWSVHVFTVLAASSLLGGGVLIVRITRARDRWRWALLGIHVAMWLPALLLAKEGQFQILVYWGFCCLYLLVAALFSRRVRRDGIGGWMTVTGFVLWALCFLVHPFIEGYGTWNEVLEQIWSMQKFVVIIGMMLTLLEDQTRLRETEAMHDPLTGLPNRRLFNDRVVQALARSRRTGVSSALFIIDLNGFKLINDTFGHRVGDSVLLCAAAALRSTLRSTDTLARCGGDEFAIVVNDLRFRDDAEKIAQSLRAVCSAAVLPGPEEIPHLRCSVGFAIYPEDASTPEELYELADVRMYADKRTGRRGVPLQPVSVTVATQFGPGPVLVGSRR